MRIQTSIEQKVAAAFAPLHVDVINESRQHRGPADAETHFKLVIVSPQFAAQSRIARHREVNQLLADELQAGVHALSLQLYTPEEWEQRGGVIPRTPPCMGGSRHAS
jgi:BolA protein